MIEKKNKQLEEDAVVCIITVVEKLHIFTCILLNFTFLYVYHMSALHKACG